MTKPEKKVTSYRFRFALVIFILLLAFAAIVGRIVYLHVLDQGFLRNQGDARTLRVVTIPAYRGMITDRHGEPLAVTTPVDSIWADPQHAYITQKQLLALSQLLDIPVQTLKERLEKNAQREFVYLKRQVHPEIAQQIEDLAIPGVYLQREYRRYYPSGGVTGHIVGFTDLDDHGREGLELAYDQWLQGKPGSKRVLKDRLGRVVQDVEQISEPEQGHVLVTSIDRRLQYIAHRELANAVMEHEALSGSLVVLDIKTGEILAMANHPSYNPNNWGDRVPDRSRNRAVTDLFEPGSVLKALAMASILETGTVPDNVIVDTNPGRLWLGGKLVRDIRNYGRLNLTGILARSSNVGISKLFLLQGSPFLFYNALYKLGFGKITGSGFPGERSGQITKPIARDRFSQSTQLFGYGLSVTMLQLAQAYAVLGSGGVKRSVTFLKQDPDTVVDEERVFSEDNAKKMLERMITVIQSGSSRAKIPGYTVAGKTGTTRKLDPAGGYSEDKHRALFAGLVPGTDPRFVMVVMIDEPSKGVYYGGLVAAPVFSKVMAHVLRLYNIAPDNLGDSPKEAQARL